VLVGQSSQTLKAQDPRKKEVEKGRKAKRGSGGSNNGGNSKPSITPRAEPKLTKKFGHMTR